MRTRMYCGGSSTGSESRGETPNSLLTGSRAPEHPHLMSLQTPVRRHRSAVRISSRRFGRPAF